MLEIAKHLNQRFPINRDLSRLQRRNSQQKEKAVSAVENFERNADSSGWISIQNKSRKEEGGGGGGKRRKKRRSRDSREILGENSWRESERINYRARLRGMKTGNKDIAGVALPRGEGIFAFIRNVVA